MTSISARQRNYRASAPPATHFDPATCEDVDCPRWLGGFAVNIPVADGLYAGRVRAARAMGPAVEVLVTDGDWTPVDVTVPPWDVDIDKAVGMLGAGRWHVFLYPPGTTCPMQSQHRKRRDRPFLFTREDQDQRVAHTPDGWLEDFAEHQDRLARRLG
jgi:hypothetical protein